MAPERRFVDCYGVLGVPHSASYGQIRKAFRQLALRYHPDKNPGNMIAAEKFLVLRRAVDVLSDPALKAEHDLEMKVGRADLERNMARKRTADQNRKTEEEKKAAKKKAAQEGKDARRKAAQEKKAAEELKTAWRRATQKGKGKRERESAKKSPQTQEGEASAKKRDTLETKASQWKSAQEKKAAKKSTQEEEAARKKAGEKRKSAARKMNATKEKEGTSERSDLGGEQERGSTDGERIGGAGIKKQPAAEDFWYRLSEQGVNTAGSPGAGKAEQKDPFAGGVEDTGNSADGSYCYDDESYFFDGHHYYHCGDIIDE